MLNKSVQTFLNKNVGRCTSFTFIYWIQNSDYSDLQDLYCYLANLGVPSCCSPIHDQDILDTSDDGVVEFKKPHVHVVIDFGSGQNKTISQCFELLNPFRDFISIAPFDRFNSPEDPKFSGAVDVWKRENCVRNMRTLLRYFKHLDNPEKHQYISSCDSLSAFGGFEIEDRLFSQSDCYVLLDEILDFIEREEVYSYWQLVSFCRKNNKEWFSVLCRNQFSNIIYNAIKSFTFDNTGGLQKRIDRYEFDSSSL